MRLGVEAWRLWESGHDDFSVGELHNFVLHCSMESFCSSDVRVVRYTHLRGNLYEVTACIVFKASNLIIVDFGQLAYSTGQQVTRLDVGDWITGRVSANIDLWEYKEEFGQPFDINRGWRIHRIFHETTPWLEKEPGILLRDDSRFSEAEVNKTNVHAMDITDDTCFFAFYTLECSTVRLRRHISIRHLGSWLMARTCRCYKVSTSSCNQRKWIFEQSARFQVPINHIFFHS
jgi:hypothetical protein